MTYNKLTIQCRSGVGYLLMGAHGRFNKLTVNMLRELKRAVAQLEADESVSCIVLSGHPGESFAVGADIGQMVKFGAGEAHDFAVLGQSLFAALEACPKPVIGALNGITMGGGCDLALACDLRIASDSLVYAHPGARLGIITGFCGTQKLPRLVGRNTAREIFMTSEPYDAAHALRCGFVNRVVPRDAFWDETVALAEAIASRRPAALALAKRVINAADDLDLRHGCSLEALAHAGLFPPVAGVN